MYQWIETEHKSDDDTTYTYQQDWAEDFHDSNGFY